MALIASPLMSVSGEYFLASVLISIKIPAEAIELIQNLEYGITPFMSVINKILEIPKDASFSARKAGPVRLILIKLSSSTKFCIVVFCNCPPVNMTLFKFIFGKRLRKVSSG